MPRVKKTSLVAELLVATFMVTLGQLGELPALLVKLETTFNDQRVAAATAATAALAVGGQADDANRRDWSVVL